MEVHFVDVGCGDMTLLLLPNGKTILVDCNLTQKNFYSIINYMAQVMNGRRVIDIFINTHRDADHFRGIELIHSAFPIQKVWDSGVVGTTPDSNEYRVYMNLRRTLGFVEIQAHRFFTFGDTIIRVLNSKHSDYSDANDQSIVVKAEFKSPGNSVIITGDASFKPWKEKILPYYSRDLLKCAILQASHHGSITFFDDPSDENNYFADHIRAMNPSMTIVSVGPNSNGLPDENAMKLYTAFSKGSKQGNKVFTTQDKGNIKLVFENNGWRLTPHN